ncbi:MAG: hypothetical protein ISR69_08630 [Gammaproteobacteria bacterium]|nr:hypothetical protein [Gammaproteobacteria bacterium]
MNEYRFQDFSADDLTTGIIVPHDLDSAAMRKALINVVNFKGKHVTTEVNTNSENNCTLPDACNPEYYLIEYKHLSHLD